MRANRWFRRGWSRRQFRCIACYWGRYLRLHGHGVNCCLWYLENRLNRRSDLRLDPMLGEPGHFLGGCRGRRHDCERRSRRRFRGNGYRGRWARHRLRRNESWRRLRRLHGSGRRSAGSHSGRLGSAAGRTRGHSRWRSHCLSWRSRRRCGSSGTRRHLRLGGLLRNRLQHVSRLGDVRQVDLGLELFRQRTRAATAGAAGLSVLRVILLHALRLVHFNGAGVRFLFRDPNLQQ
jgi:hypothetical protein